MISAAIVGLGRWGRALTEASLGHDRLKLVRAVEPDIDGARDFCSRHRIELAESLDAVLADDAIDDAFPGSRFEVDAEPGALFRLTLRQPGLLRALSAAELSDGTLRYLLLVAALMTPRPPALSTGRKAPAHSDICGRCRILPRPMAEIEPPARPVTTGLQTMWRRS